MPKTEQTWPYLSVWQKKLGMSAKTLTPGELEDWQLVQKMEEGMKSGNATRNEVMKALGK